MPCEFCGWLKTDTEGESCNAMDDGWQCTRIAGHDGNHVACSSYCHSDHAWAQEPQQSQRTDTERLDFLLRHFRVEDVGDEEVCLELRTSEEFGIPIDITAKHASGSLMVGWTCDARQVIDAAIERSNNERTTDGQ